MNVIEKWKDDHLPCISFIHGADEKEFSLWWADPKVAAIIELIETNDVQFDVLRKYAPDLVDVLDLWKTVTQQDEDGNDDQQEVVDGEERVCIYVDAGMLEFSRPARK